jgi:hypothetical protein
MEKRAGNEGSMRSHERIRRHFKVNGKSGAHAAWGVRLILTTGGLRKYKIEIEINRKLAVHTPSTP